MPSGVGGKAREGLPIPINVSNVDAKNSIASQYRNGIDMSDVISY